MKITIEEAKNLLLEKGLKVTPQRSSILEAVFSLENHPSAEGIIDFIRQKHPHIATGTVYKVLDTLVDKQLIKRVKTDRDSMRYEPVIEDHHHLYCADTGKIEDYTDHELDRLLEDYFRQHGIPGFEIQEIRLQINGKFTN
jgi:Fur family peroxide stress response transcriptional regulator